MKKFYERYLKNINIFLALGICLAAALCFAGFLFWASRDSQREAQEIQEQVQQREQQESQAAEPTAEPEDVPAPEAGESEGEPAAPEETAPVADQNSAAVQPAGISCRGDDFMDANDAPTYAYPVILQQLLNQNGKAIPVENKGLYGAGTLSQLKFAGVPDTDIQAYITAHSAAGGELAATETGVRDFTAEELARTDQNYIPVLFMGFYGGWNNDLQELIAQQEKILATYTGNPDQYLILGYPNTGTPEGDAAYEDAMTQRWQEHYVSLRQQMQGSVYTYAGQEEMAGIVYQKLTELGYLG